MILYTIIVAGIVMLTAIVFEALLGARIVKLQGAAHWKTHRYLAYMIILVGVLHGLAAVGLLVFAWF